MRADGRALIDDTGHFKPLGISYFQVMKKWKHERANFMADMAWLKPFKLNYGRVICDFDPADPQKAYDQQTLAEVMDYFWTVLGWRVELTFIGYNASNKAPRLKPMDLAASICEVVNDGRQHMVLNAELYNEYYGRGVSLAEMIPLGKFVRSRIPNLVALSSPALPRFDKDVVAATIAAGCNLLSVHSNRGKGDFKWRQVRQPFDERLIRLALTFNEPPGHGSSVETNTSPLQLAMMRAVEAMCGGGAHVIHTGTGVFGDGVPHHSAGPRPAKFSDIPDFAAALTAIRGIDALLPDGVQNWQVANTQWHPPNPLSPFEVNDYWEEGDGHNGVNKAYSALGPDGRVIQMPCGVKKHVIMTANYPLRDVTVYDPLSPRTPVAGYEKLSLAKGKTLELPGRVDTMAAYIIHGTRL